MNMDQVPRFIAEVLTQVNAGLDEFNRGDPIAKAGRPEYIDIQLSVVRDDEYQQLWIKVPFSVHERLAPQEKP